jgi:PASTA domain
VPGESSHVRNEEQATPGIGGFQDGASGYQSRMSDPPIPPRPPVRRVAADDVVVYPLGGPEVVPGVVHEQDRVRVLPDGSVQRERDRVIEPIETGYDWRPWLIIGACLLAVVIAGVWYFTRSSSATATTPNAVGLPQAQARDRLVQAGFTVTSVVVPSGLPSGTVVAQAPPAGESITRGTLVRINISSGHTTAPPATTVTAPTASTVTTPTTSTVTTNTTTTTATTVTVPTTSTVTVPTTATVPTTT